MPSPFGVRYSTMAVLIGAVVIFVFWLLAVLGVIVGSILLVDRMGSPKRPKRQVPPIPPGLQEFYEEPAPELPVTKTNYIPRWGLYRKHSVAADKAQWETDFDRLLRG
jgi:hypothetical protein